jgi:hypothetical protein
MELIEFHFNQMKLRVLKSMIEAQKKFGVKLAFSDIRSQIISEENKEEIDNSLVYRCLTMLEDEGYIEIDRKSYRHLYHTDHYLIEQALKRLKEAKMKVLLELKKSLDEEKSAISKVDSSKLVKKLQKFLSGPLVKNQPRFAYGLEGIYWMIDNEIYDKAKTGDIIRMTLDWVKPDQERENQRYTIARELSKRGVKIKVLTHADQDFDSISFEFRIKMYSQLKNLNTKVNARISANSSNTYQFVARNNLGIVLIVSENPLTGMWIPRASNQSLVNDAVERFDDDFSGSRDMQDMFQEEKKR